MPKTPKVWNSIEIFILKIKKCLYNNYKNKVKSTQGLILAVEPFSFLSDKVEDRA